MSTVTTDARVMLMPEPPIPAPPTTVPPLEQGDHLSRREFERRYLATPRLKKAELIEGIVYLWPKVRLSHGSSHADLVAWLGTYRAYTPGLHAGDSGTVRLDLDNVLRPDALLLTDPSWGGQTRIDADGYIEGAPELIAEVAATAASIDLHIKFRVYRRNQVREYIVWRVLDGVVDWFALRQTQYDRLPLGADGIYRSEVFPGLWLDAAALVRSDLLTVLQVLQQGLASPEHAAFVAALQQKAAARP